MIGVALLNDLPMEANRPPLRVSSECFIDSRNRSTECQIHGHRKIFGNRIVVKERKKEREREMGMETLF